MDNNVGMVISEITTWCVLLVGASALYKSGIREIKNAADAAKALKSFSDAGFPEKLIFYIVSSVLVY